MSVEESQTVQSFKKCNLFANSVNYFYFWDNSPNPNPTENERYSELLGNNVIYSSHIENTPLAKVYNTIISEYKDVDYVAIFDQDTVLVELDYEKKIDSALLNNPKIDLFIPKIYAKHGELYSPGKFIFPGKARKLISISDGVVSAKKLTGITSGLIVSRRFIKTENFLFNENLRLYGVDTDFFINYSKKRKELYILSVKIQHSLSFEDSNLSVAEQRKRDKERLDCLFLIYKKWYERFFVYMLKIYFEFRFFLKRMR